jgi:biotin transport system substrate-specific component
MITFAETLRGWAVQEVVEDRRARMMIGGVAFALATAFGAQVAVPLPWTPVPVTLQPLFVILAGVMLGPRVGAVAMAAYVGVGALGAPVFSNGGAGLPWLLGPTGGYLLAVPAAAFVAGSVAGRQGAAVRTLAGLALGVATMYVGGVSQLLVVTGQELDAVLAMGVVPFLVGDVMKILLAFFVVRSAKWTSTGRPQDMAARRAS